MVYDNDYQHHNNEEVLCDDIAVAIIVTILVAF